MNKITKLSEVTNGAERMIEAGVPYVATVTISGAADFLFHRWNCEAVDEKAKAAKGSKAKKSDDVESYVYRNDAGELCIPGEYLRMAVIGAAKFRQDPRSPRKSAMDLYKAAVVPLTALASLGKKEWDYEDRRRVVVQRNGINRTRPAMKAGWRATFDVQVLIPEYVDPNSLRETIETAGRLIGIGDFRPTYGRFGIVGFELI
jgi:hypothetical protein